MDDIKIDYLKLRLTIEAIDTLYLPNYKGSTLRGGFGNVMRRVVCALKRENCIECMLKDRCIYSYIFETPPKDGASIMHMNKYEKVPHPFVIEPPEDENPQREYSPGKRLHFNLILIGKAVDFLPYFIYTFDELGMTGIGKKRGRFRLIKVEKVRRGLNGWDVADEVYSSDHKTIKTVNKDAVKIPVQFTPAENAIDLTMNYITPLRLQYRRDLVVKPEFHILIRGIMRRLALLYYFHSEERPPQWDYRGIISHAESVVIQSSDLRWFDWERYSSRQDVRMKLGGIAGNVTYHGNIEPFLPILRAGEVLHAGKNTSFGLGRYEIV